MLLRPPTSTLFPYTTLFRSLSWCASINRLPTSPGRSHLRVPADCHAKLTRLQTAPTEVYQPAESHISGATCKRSEEHTSELQSRLHLVCRLLLEKKKIGHVV